MPKIKNKWSKNPESIINQISDDKNIGWDIDSTIFLLNSFIEEMSSESKFRDFVVKVANEEKENS